MSRPTLDTDSLWTISLTGLSPSLAGLSRTFLLSSSIDYSVRTPGASTRFGLFRVRSPLLTESLFIFSSSGYLDVSVHRVPSVHLWIQCTVHEVFSCGFPHSDICGSMCICHSPQLFAAYHVFHRLSVPRHPSCALCDLTFVVACSASCSFRASPELACASQLLLSEKICDFFRSCGIRQLSSDSHISHPHGLSLFRVTFRFRAIALAPDELMAHRCTRLCNDTYFFFNLGCLTHIKLNDRTML